MPQEFTFKQADGLDIKLDVYLPKTSKPAPVLIWWHGGGLFQGTRKGVPTNLARLLNARGVALVSPDYRVAPQTPLPLIIEDAKDALTFVRDKLPSLVDGKIDSTKVAVSGGSAGGWLALLVGLELKPAAIAAIYPITDVDEPFYTTEQHPVSYLPDEIPHEKAAPHIDPTSPPLSFSELTSPRAIVYHYTLQQALWHKLWFANAAQAPTASTDPAAYSVREKITKDAPPIFIISGSKDDKVDPKGAARLADQLKTIGAQYEWVERDGADHLFDQKPEEEVPELHAFLAKHGC